MTALCDWRRLLLVVPASSSAQRPQLLSSLAEKLSQCALRKRRSRAAENPCFILDLGHLGMLVLPLQELLLLWRQERDGLGHFPPQRFSGMLRVPTMKLFLLLFAVPWPSPGSGAVCCSTRTLCLSCASGPCTQQKHSPKWKLEHAKMMFLEGRTVPQAGLGLEFFIRKTCRPAAEGRLQTGQLPATASWGIHLRLTQLQGCSLRHREQSCWWVSKELASLGCVFPGEHLHCFAALSPRQQGKVCHRKSCSHTAPFQTHWEGWFLDPSFNSFILSSSVARSG